MGVINLQNEWLTLCKNIGAVGDVQTAYNEIKKRYTERHRRYHAFGHIAHCLGEFNEEVRELALHPEETEMALWLHDVIYDPAKNDNEEQSAAFAIEMLRALQIRNPVIFRISRLILWTTHIAMPEGIDAQITVDIDLSPLGAPREKFLSNRKDIRYEYRNKSDEEFRIDTIAFLERFLARPRIFFTEYFITKYEAQAQKNLHTSLAELRAV